LGSPVEPKTVRMTLRDGYGWTEFVHHTGYSCDEGSTQFFRGAGARLDRWRLTRENKTETLKT
jgi:hypothetical protein